MDCATLEAIDKISLKIGTALGKNVTVEYGGGYAYAKLLIDGHAVPGVSGTKQKCYDALQIFWAGIEELTLALKEHKASLYLAFTCQNA
jgi:hypothetical protein